MKLYSTNDKNNVVDLRTAVLNSLPKDKGLYLPTHISKISPEKLSKLSDLSFQEIALEVTRSLLSDSLTDQNILTLVTNSINFPAPVVELDKQAHILELFHGPSLAFKDFGARYMSQLMAVLNKDEDKELTILVATSGDTGGAVAAGFYDTPGIKVHILYPSGKVSALQEKQLTTLGKNIHAFEVDGTFDDCQSIVKQAFVDDQLNERFRLSSANSINIARLIPQSFYYFEGYKQVVDKGLPVTFTVPSGNFGNITAGILAKRMGLPVHKFIAATNINNIVPNYLENGTYEPKPSVQTISNAMDVGNPSNFARMKELYKSDLESFNRDMVGYWFNDADTRLAMKEVYDKYNYVIDPHGAVGYLAHKAFINTSKEEVANIILETAHPSKFLDVVEPALGGLSVEVPERLAILQDKQKVATSISSNFSEFKNWMMSNRF